MSKIFVFKELGDYTVRIRFASSKIAFLNQIVNNTSPETFNHIKNNILEWKEYCNGDANKSYQLDANFNFQNKRIDFIYDSLDGKSEYNIYVNDSEIKDIELKDF